ncbi:MAG: NACHT domain-containing protein [Verrucomicrobiales bacterium]|nr:NACHT domain-containing protein [Verrucomicrobiales bacterium]
MAEAATAQDQERETADLKAFVLREVLPVFRASHSPKLTDAEVESAVGLLFDLLEHRIDDPNLDGIGTQVLECLARRFCSREHVTIADRFEPFAKFVLNLAFPARYESLAATLRNRFTLAEILKELRLAQDSELKAWSLCPWQQFPPAGLSGTPDFKEQVGWTVRFRNTEDHLAPELDDVRESKLVQSVCVCLVWLTAKFEREIRLTLTRSRLSDYLQSVQTRFADIGSRFVELTTEARSAEEYRLLVPLAPSPEAVSSSEITDASKVADVNRVTVIEANPGAGKTWTLQSVAWRQAEGLLSGKPDYDRIPVYVELKLAAHDKRTIKEAVHEALKAASGEARPIPWNSLLLLVDGVNEVATQHQTAFKAELRDLLSRFTKLRVVLAGRPNSFRGEFEARIVVLRRLSDEQLSDLFRRALDDAGRAGGLLDIVRHSPFLSSWARTPLHAAMVVSLAKQGGIDALADHSTTVRRFVRDFLSRETDQASAPVTRTDFETKELLIARLAFETKCSNQGAFSRTTARSILATAKFKAVAPSLDISRFLEEIRDNHLLERAVGDAMEFAHELYHDYFAATELETREQLQVGLGTEFALGHFAETHWSECIRLFAGYSNANRILVERGAAKNPFLAWQLLRDTRDGTPELAERVSDEAYCALSAELKSAAQATMAGACVFVLADLGRADLLEQAITEQSQAFEPKRLREGTDAEKEAVLERQKQVALPPANGLLLLVRLGLMEQKFRQEGRFCQAARAAIRGLERIKAARVLCAMLSAWTGGTFSEPALIPGAVLDALVRLGVDEVLDREDKSMNQTLALWLKRASEAGLSKAWAAYGRVLRLARRVYVADTGLEFDGESALKWLRQSHEAGDSSGTLELALLLVEEPEFANEVGQGERMLRQLAQTNLEARYELGLRLLKGEDLPKNEPEGFEHLLSAAESGHAEAKREVDPLLCGQLIVDPSPHIELPTWAKPYQSRLTALFPNNPRNLT